jgi:hypothetical protein
MIRPSDRLARRVRLATSLLFLWISTSVAFGQPSVQITSPTEGTVASPGQTLAVTVAASGANFQMVSVIGQAPLGFSGVLSAPPFQFSIQIPSDTSPRRYTLTAVGTIAPGQNVTSAPISIDVERSDAPTAVNVEPALLMLRVSDPGFLRVVATYADDSTADVSQSTQIVYASDKPAVATVDSVGRVTAVGPGSASISIAFGGNSVQVPVTVRQPVRVIPTTASVYTSQTEPYIAQLAMPAGTDPTVTWSINPSLGSIDSNGLYTAPSSVDSWQGVTVTATSVADPTKSGTAQIWVFPPVSIGLDPASTSLSASCVQSFNATVHNADNASVNWSLSPSGVGTVLSSGDNSNRFGFGTGGNLYYGAPAPITSPQTVTVTATSVADNSRTASAHITLVPSPVPALSVSPATVTLYSSQNQRLAATFPCPEFSGPTWSLSPSVGDIDSWGSYTAPLSITSPQTVTVTATYLDYTATAAPARSQSAEQPRSKPWPTPAAWPTAR